MVEQDSQLLEKLLESFDLEENETPIHYWSDIRDPTAGFVGVVILTNQRLVFINEIGIFKKSYELFTIIRLEQIKRISFEGFWIQCVKITCSKDQYGFQGLNESNFNFFRKRVLDQVKLRNDELQTEKKREKEEIREKVYIVLDFSFLKDYMKKGGLLLKTIECPKCGAPLKLPKSGNQIECQHCGSTVLAQDIFEKMKALIG